ncbi:hypothetical protein EVAR_22496_1 [Eumeta japonica]|uniref:Uncharacterized protein n=1 Tax=Eumeta variegata TaxID=151549 RepID=A0A4C1ZFX4_EUMVA|nr:hypothetical protein EVAR_22496_1 [Eumeta japonica]
MQRRRTQRALANWPRIARRISTADVPAGSSTVMYTAKEKRKPTVQGRVHGGCRFATCFVEFIASGYPVLEMTS